MMLPLEMSDCIIDYLHSHSRALLACSLTCRSWRARSQLHLFRSVTLDNKQRITQLVRTLICAPHLSSHIRHVWLPITLEHCEPFVALCPLPKVHSLTIGPGRITSFATLGELRSFGYGRFPLVRSIILQGLFFSCSPHILSLLHHLPLLVDVRLTSIHTTPHSGHGLVEPVPDTPVPSLERLSLDGCTGANSYALWMSEQAIPWVQNLRWLQFRDVDMSNNVRWLSPVGGLAGRLSGTLEELYIVTPRIEVLEAIVADYRDSRCTHSALRKLVVCVIGGTGGPGRVVELFRLVREMELDANALIEIRTGDDVPHGMEWDVVIAELSRDAFPWKCLLGFLVEKMSTQRMDCVHGENALAPFGIAVGRDGA